MGGTIVSCLVVTFIFGVENSSTANSRKKYKQNNINFIIDFWPF